MPQQPAPGTPSRTALALIWIGVGLLMMIISGWVAFTRWPAVLNGHPIMLASLAACLLIGAVAVIWAAATLLGGARQDALGDPEHPKFRPYDERVRRAKLRIGLAVPALLVSLLLTGWLGYARPFSASDVAVAAMVGGSTVSVEERPTWYELVPKRRDANGNRVEPTTGLVFVPGARVDPRAYAPVLRPLAAAGYLVIVIKEPFNFAIPTSRRPGELMDLHPTIRYWAVGGHSLGGVNAAAYANSDLRVSGLLFYASYPASPVTRGSLKVTSISGSADGLATPSKIDDSKAELPPTTTYVIIQGGVHAYFGDYGEQPGDGQPGVDRATAQAEIVKSTAALLASLAPTRTR